MWIVVRECVSGSSGGGDSVTSTTHSNTHRTIMMGRQLAPKPTRYTLPKPRTILPGRQSQALLLLFSLLDACVVACGVFDGETRGTRMQNSQPASLL